MVDAGQLALVIAFVVTAYAVLASFVGAWQRIPDLTASARYGFYSVPALLFVSTAALVYAFVTRDFSVRYVAGKQQSGDVAHLHMGRVLRGQRGVAAGTWRWCWRSYPPSPC